MGGFRLDTLGVEQHQGHGRDHALDRHKPPQPGRLTPAGQDAPLSLAIELEGQCDGRLRSSEDFREGNGEIPPPL
jgi:hypothetical protein